MAYLVRKTYFSMRDPKYFNVVLPVVFKITIMKGKIVEKNLDF